jgi:hypothetical protein
MVSCRALDVRAKARNRQYAALPTREALAAATAIHLQPGDVLCAQADDALTHHLAPATRTAAEGRPSEVHGSELIAPAAAHNRLLLATAAAHALKTAARPGDGGIVLAFAQTSEAEPEWAAALEWAQQAELPLILAVADAAAPAKPRSRTAVSRAARLSWTAISAFARRTKLPVLTVDGMDAVALYRAMQESTIRARSGLGPAVLWAVMEAGALKPSQLPIARLRQYMKVRGIALR